LRIGEAVLVRLGVLSWMSETKREHSGGCENIQASCRSLFPRVAPLDAE